MRKIYLLLTALFATFYSFAVTPIGGPTSVCKNATITLTDATSGGTWTSSNTAVATVGSSTGLVFGVNAGVVTITYTVSSSFVTCNITVNPLPSLYTVTGGGAYCAGGAGLHVGLSGSNPGIMYQLLRSGSPAGSSVAGSGTAIDFGLQTVAGSYTVVATDPVTGCTATMIGSVTITVNPLPTIFAITGGGTYCVGGPGVHIGLSGSQLGVHYQLYNGASPSGAPLSGTSSSIDFGMSTTGVYTIVATDPVTGCTATMTGTVTVTVVPIPTVPALMGGGTFCAGVMGHLTTTTSSAGIYYILDSAGIAIDTITGTGGSLDFGYHMGGSFTLRAVSIAGGCSSTMGSTAMITINPTVIPAVSISASPGTTVTPGTMVNFVAVGVNGGSTPTYSWYVNGTSVGGSSVYTYVPSNGDIVAVCMTSSAACASPLTVCDTVTMTVTPSTGITSAAIDKVDIRPNPAGDNLAIVSDHQSFGAYAISDCTGRTMLMGTITSSSAMVDVSTLPSGLYYINLTGINESAVRKFVKL